MGARVLFGDANMLRASWRAASLPIATAFALRAERRPGARLPGWDRAPVDLTFSYNDPLYGTLRLSGAIDVAPIPEPATSLLVLAGLAALAARHRRRRA